MIARGRTSVRRVGAHREHFSPGTLTYASQRQRSTCSRREAGGGLAASRVINRHASHPETVSDNRTSAPVVVER